MASNSGKESFLLFFGGGYIKSVSDDFSKDSLSSVLIKFLICFLTFDKRLASKSYSADSVLINRSISGATEV